MLICAIDRPKMDAVGACDPYVKVQIGSQTFQTALKKNVYEAEFNQYFDFLTVSRNDILKVSQFCVHVDWVGRFHLCGAENRGIFCVCRQLFMTGIGVALIQKWGV